MIIKAVNENAVTAGRRHARLPVPVADIAHRGGECDEARPRGARRFAAATHRPGRPSAAFLAQLCLQYDDGARLRRARLERSAHAARVYGAALARRAEPASGRGADLRI